MQIAVLNDYDDGDHADLIAMGEIPDDYDYGDGLLKVILIELSDEENCESVEMGLGRLQTAKDDIDVAYEALMKISVFIDEKV